MDTSPQDSRSGTGSGTFGDAKLCQITPAYIPPEAEQELALVMGKETDAQTMDPNDVAAKDQLCAQLLSQMSEPISFTRLRIRKDEGDRIFGSVGSDEIVQLLNNSVLADTSLLLKAKQLEIPDGKIKSLGEFQVAVTFESGEAPVMIKVRVHEPAKSS